MKPTLESIQQRNSRRLSEDILEPVTVETIDDIRMILDELDPAKNIQQKEINISTTMMSSEGGSNVKYNVNANTRSKSKRDMLVEGFEVLRKRMETLDSHSQDIMPLIINGKEVKPAELKSNTESHTWVDPLIKQWTGGQREGLFITWNLKDGYKYKYEIISHKFSRVKQ